LPTTFEPKSSSTSIVSTTRLPNTGENDDVLTTSAGLTAFFGAVGATLFKKKERKDSVKEDIHKN
jgi:LPXTG-motif cell wall-anchored protein